MGAFMDTKDILKNRLEELIEARKDTDYHYNISKQCEQMDINYQTFQKYLKGISQCSAENLIKIANYYKVSVDYLLGLTDISTTNKDLRFVCDYTGLSEKAVTTLKADNESVLHKYIINWLIEQKTVLHKLGNYLTSSIFTFFSLSPYVRIPCTKNWEYYIHRIDLAKSVNLAELIDALPLAEEKISSALKEDKKMQEELVFALTCRMADIEECERICNVDTNATAEEYIKGNSRLSPKWAEVLASQERAKAEFIREFIRWFLDKKGGVNNG